MADGERPVLVVATLGEVFDRAAELSAQRPLPRLVAGDRAVRISADGRWLARRAGRSELVESGRVTYAEGITEVELYRVADRQRVLAREYPYHWNDGDRPSSSEMVDDVDFSPDGDALVVTLARGHGRQRQVREERIPLPRAEPPAEPAA